MSVDIRAGSIEEALTLANGIPEFNSPPTEQEWQQRLSVKPLVLIAVVDDQLAGFKAGYDRWQDGETYYSWMGGVLPAHRRSGVATALQRRMESWCRESGYSQLRFKTRNQHRQMILFAIQNGFDLIGFEEKSQVRDHRLLFEKRL